LIATHGRADYGPDDLAFAEQVAARAAMAVDNARLYREAREQQRRAAADREELRAQRDLYEALMRAQSELGEAFAVLEGERIVFVNRATERLTGRTADELYALDSAFVLVAPEHHRAIGARLRDARLGIEPREPGFVTEIVRPDGARVPIEAAGRLLRTEQAARRASEAAHARVRLLADASALLERSISDEESLQDVAELLVAQLSDAAMIDVL